MPLALFLFLEIALAIQGLIWLHKILVKDVPNNTKPKEVLEWFLPAQGSQVHRGRTEVESRTYKVSAGEREARNESQDTCAPISQLCQLEQDA